MGADIHPHIELKINGKWFYVGQVQHWRNYELFGHLSGVRNEPLVRKFFETEYDGLLLPVDITKELKKEYDSWEGDSHTLTVVSFSGLKSFIKERGDVLFIGMKLKYSSTHNWLELMKKLSKNGVEDSRIILWYDN